MSLCGGRSAGWFSGTAPFISLCDREPTPTAAITTGAPVAMNIWDTKINWLHQKILPLSPPHHLNGEFIPLWAAFTAETEWWLLKLLWHILNWTQVYWVMGQHFGFSEGHPSRRPWIPSQLFLCQKQACASLLYLKISLSSAWNNLHFLHSQTCSCI